MRRKLNKDELALAKNGLKRIDETYNRDINWLKEDQKYYKLLLDSRLKFQYEVNVQKATDGLGEVERELKNLTLKRESLMDQIKNGVETDGNRNKKTK